MSAITFPTYPLSIRNILIVRFAIPRGTFLLERHFNSRMATDRFTVFLEIPFRSFNPELARNAFLSGEALSENRKVRLIIGVDTKGATENEVINAIYVLAACHFVDGVLLNPVNLGEVCDSLNVGLHILDTGLCQWSGILRESLKPK